MSIYEQHLKAMRGYNKPWRRIIGAYTILKDNEAYWLMDNDYKRKYAYLKEASTMNTRYSSGTVDYLSGIAVFMVKANNQIFKTQYEI